MPAATLRIPVLVTPEEKARIAAAAASAGVSMGEFLRRSAANPSSADDLSALEGLLGQVERSTQAASAAIDDALAYVAASNKRIDAMERRHVRKAA